MPTTSITRDNKFWTTTLIALAKESTDQLHIFTPWFDIQKKKFGGNGKPAWDGGDLFMEPIQVSEHSQLTPTPTGYEPINLSVTDTEVPMYYTWFAGVMPIVISEIEEKKNSGPNAIAKIIERRHATVMAGFKQKFVQQTLAGNVAGYTDLLTLNGVDNTTSGFLEEDAVGAQGNTIGGFSKTTYAGLPGAQNQVYDVSDSFDTYGLASLAYINTKIQTRHPKHQKPDAWLWSEAFSYNAKRSIQAFERYVGGGGEGVDAGKMYSLWDGVPCYVESLLPKTGTNTTGNPISAIALSMDHCKTMWHPQGFFAVSEFVSGRPNQLIRAATILVMAQNTINNFGCQGIIHSGENF